MNKEMITTSKPLIMSQVEITEISELNYEQYWAVINAHIETKLLRDNEIGETTAYEALMDALDKFEDDPMKTCYLGESERDPHITALLTLADYVEDTKGSDDVSSVEESLPERYFFADIFYEE